MSDSNGHLTVNELAEHPKVRVSVRTVRRWLAETDVPHFRVGDVIRFDLEEVLAWMKARAENHEPAPSGSTGTAA